ncbi:MAG: 30S ribosomal protein S9 [bacterium]|nr:30S ribosomal protein S9 [bacterium]
MNELRFYGTGKRKRAVARVWLLPGDGKIMVNGKEMDEYFGRKYLVASVRQPMVLTDTINKFDVRANIKGGGVLGQVGALRHGISRALVQANEEFRPILKKSGFLTRDPREHERKKYGQAGRRKRFQYSKR